METQNGSHVYGSTNRDMGTSSQALVELKPLDSIATRTGANGDRLEAMAKRLTSFLNRLDGSRTDDPVGAGKTIVPMPEGVLSRINNNVKREEMSIEELEGLISALDDYV